MSRRLNLIYNEWSPTMEVYSIDESFLDLMHSQIKRTLALRP